MADPVVIPDPGTAEPVAGGGSEALMSRIADLEDALARERAKNQVLMEQVLQLEDGQADTDVGAFSDVIPNDSRDYWRGLLLENRSETVAELTRMRNRCKRQGCQANADTAAAPAAEPAAAPAAAPSPAPARPAAPKPLHNRAAASVPAASAFGGPGVTSVSGDKAVWLRNRAHAIHKAQGGSFTKAFAQAETEAKLKG